MRILFLDDDRNRSNTFVNRMYDKAITTVVETPAEAKEALERHRRFDIVSLDHDLYGKIYQPSDENSGFEVCRFLYHALDVEKLPDKIICHSYNDEGVENMMRELEPLYDKVRCIAEKFASEAYWGCFAPEEVFA